MNIFYYDIALELPLRQCFTYKSKVIIKKGTRVIVPFGKKSIIGIVVKRISNPGSLKRLREIISVADDYTSHNTTRLDVPGIKELLMKLPLIRSELDA